MNDHLAKILRSNQSVFTFKDVILLWGETDPRQAKKRIYRYVKARKLYSIRRGIYAKDGNYDRLELANKIFLPSYISFETVLAKEGIIFQHYDQLFAASYLTREITCDGGVYFLSPVEKHGPSKFQGYRNQAPLFDRVQRKGFLGYPLSISRVSFRQPFPRRLEQMPGNSADLWKQGLG